MRRALLATLAVLPAYALAQPEDEAAREAEMFGEEAPAEEAPAAPAPAEEAPRGDREAELFGGDAPLTTPSRTIDDRLDQFHDPLAVGGALWLRLQFITLTDGDVEDFPLSSPNLLDLYLDARPTERLRAFVQGRVVYDPTADAAEPDAFGGTPETVDVALDQLWLKLDFGRAVFVTAGKQRIKWGTGRFWNPTDFLNVTRLQPLSIFDERLGVPLVKVHVPIESLGWNLYALAQFDDANSPADVGGALRAEFLLGVTEISTSVVARNDEPLRLGADVSTGLLDPFDLYAEFALVHGAGLRRWEGDFAFGPGGLPSATPTLVDREDDWIPAVSAGFEWGIKYSDQDSLYISGEYFYNGNGYDGADLYPWLLFQGDFVPFYTGEHYTALSFVLPAPGNWNDTTFVLSGLGNLSDQSFLTRLDYQVTVLTRLRLYLFANYHFGENGEFNFSLEIPPTPLDPALENGLKVPAPLVDLGVWLALDL